MQIFKNRPLALAICAFTLAALLAFKLSGTFKIIGFLFFGAMAIGVGVFGLKRKRLGKRGAQAMLCAIGIALALLQSWFHFQLSADWFHQRIDQTITAEGYVAERLDSAKGQSRFGVWIQEADGERRKAKVLLEFDGASALQEGDTFRLTAKPRRSVNTEDYREELILTADGYVGVLICSDTSDCSILEEQHLTLPIRARRLRAVLADRIQSAMKGEEGALAAAIFLGDRGRLSSDTVLDFRRGGISHLLALSGLHVSIFIGFWELLLRRLRVHRQIRTVIVPLIAISYLILTGCALSTVRAVLMTCVVYLAYVFWADYDPFTSLCLALFFILVVSPYAVTDVSLWLSFVATAGIVIFLPAFSEWYDNVLQKAMLPRWILRLGKAILVAIAIGFFTNAAILPLLAYFFGTTSIFSVGLTLMLSPLIGIAIVSAALSLLFPWCSPILFFGRWIFRLILLAANRASNTRNAVVLLTGDITLALIGLLAALLILLAIIYLKEKRWLLIPIALSVAILGVAASDALPRDAGVAVTYLRQNNEEALLIADGRNAIAVDFSGGSSFIGTKIYQATMESNCTELQELILTHYHSQAAHLISSLSGKIKVRALRLPEPNCEKERAIAARLEQEAALHEIVVYYGTDHFDFEEIRLCFAEREASESTVEVPVVFSLEIQGHSIVYLGGNAWEGALEPLAKSQAISADWLILGAHGASKTPSEDFFDGLNDVDCVIFGSESLMDSCPREALPDQYCYGEESKRFFLKRTAYR